VVDLRELCALEAMKYIKNDYIIGLGAGRNIQSLIKCLSSEVKNGLKIKIVTPSYSTKKLCIQNGIEVLETYFVHEVDVAFDGCGEVDKCFYASKSGGGVFTKEKLIAAMAKEYILLIDESKYSSKLDERQTISLEVIKDSLAYVKRNLVKVGGTPVVRTSNVKDGYIITDDGNFLIDVKFDFIEDFKALNIYIKNIEGVIGTGLFKEEVTKLIISSESGARVISKTRGGQ
jgi:ribose 5-phosphate isomerase A